MKRSTILGILVVLTTPLGLAFMTVPQVGLTNSGTGARTKVALRRPSSFSFQMKTMRQASVTRVPKILKHVKRHTRRLNRGERKKLGLTEWREAHRESESWEDVEPLNTDPRVSIKTTDAGSLQISIPALGFTRSSHSEIGAAGCFLAIAARVTPAITSGIGGMVIGTFFALPFWLGGGALAQRSLVDPMTSVELSIGTHAWNLNKKAVRKGGISAGGPTWDLKGANVNSNISLNGHPLTFIELVAGKESCRFGTGLSVDEKQKVVNEINRWLEVNREKILEPDHDGFFSSEDYFID